MENLSLYQISGRFYELMARVAADETLTEEEANEQHNELALMLQRKTPGVIGYYRQMEVTVDAVDAEIKRLSAMKSKLEKAKENYKQYVKDCMDMMGISEISTNLGMLKIAKNPMSVEVLNADEVPEEFKKTTVTVAVDKNAIKQHIKDVGEIIPGIEIINNRTRLDIR